MNAPDLLLSTDHYTEGVVVDRDGTIFFSMTSIGTISRFAPGDAAAVVWAHVPAANGHAIDVDGTHVVMSSTGSILRLDRSGRTTGVVASRVAGRWLTYPNDLALDPHRGGYYVTDSGYKETPKTVPAEPQGRVYRVDADGSTREVAGGIAYSNGIALSPDGTSLYVGESTARRIWSYAVFDDGSLGARTLLAETPAVPGETTVPDGITLGPDGRLYVAHYGAREVLAYDRDGRLVRRLEAGNKATSHVAFAPHGRSMYVSGGIEGESGPGAIFEILV
ncbi:MAG: SMP-30/gluconolactonase/LRE family protein [Candidatus Eremiobacteraeota bacterium]|nr:SMP-30/gluconolactonase/LRE family protein [Candidatus Eremiobacteraeota bacterium]